jgi:transcriptional regulator with XRE-family HTH domain
MCVSVSRVSDLHQRLKAAAGDRTYKAIAELTRTHPGTVRRYMTGQAPSTEFLAQFCEGLGINADWLIAGRPPMRADDVRPWAVREANITELLEALGRQLSELADRVARLERYAQTLEVKLNAATGRQDGVPLGKGAATMAHGDASPTAGEPGRALFRGRATQPLETGYGGATGGSDAAGDDGPVVRFEGPDDRR